jgi:hypothetical protein
LPLTQETRDTATMNPERLIGERPRRWIATLICSLALFGCDDTQQGQQSPSMDGRSLDASPIDDADVDAATVVDAELDVMVTDAEPTRPAIDGNTTDATGPDAASIDLEQAHRLDDRLMVHNLQALGTHNSYHLQPALPVPAWAYSHLPLDQQLGQQGVRQFELDVYYDIERADFDVYHLFAIDQETTCATLSECVAVMKGWSDEHSQHHPLLILIEVKGVNPSEHIDELLASLERIILSVWPWERLLHPDIVQGDSASLSDGIEARGWPSLGSVRGRAMFVLHDGGALRARYTDERTTTAGRVLFPDAYGDLDLPIAAYHSLNGPVGGFEQIQRVVRAGHLVRTRADSDSEGIFDLDYTRLDAALRSGAHFISTDYPFPATAEDYGVTIPGGQPSRCNPLTAPEDCLPTDIEDPGLLSP